MKNSYITLLAFLFLLIGQRTWGESVTKTVHFNLSELKCDTITGGDGQVYNVKFFCAFLLICLFGLYVRL